jgi:hypothetical protein
MTKYVVHNSAGKILWTVEDPAIEELDNVADDYYYIAVLENINPNTYWVDTNNQNSITPKSEFFSVTEKVDANTSVNTITISGVPYGSEVLWPDGEITIETDGSVVCEVTTGGAYRFVLSHTAHFNKEVIVNV